MGYNNKVAAPANKKINGEISSLHFLIQLILFQHLFDFKIWLEKSCAFIHMSPWLPISFKAVKPHRHGIVSRFLMLFLW